ncbi:GNAT family N-acetyltransferase [Paenibacillus pinisoli]|uniref:GNAT family N-acetyltransferase n=1 Tax=Paenibacillus pinisoli TaxID=1276110 RepID=A0A3A6PUP0_9BACL|nr:GNAT family N-acetyltransferase [Paenibacillus pinisoli]RJX37604.1 GNAT family N-acetyltransferase [Paenibacillus pinisoli]
MNPRRVILSAELYQELARVNGMPVKEEAQLQKALKHSLYGIALLGEEEEAIGMGRVVGDGRYTFMIADLIMHPEYANAEHTLAVLNDLMAYIEASGADGAEITLMSDVPSIPLYQKQGFAYTYPNKISLSRTL